MADLELEEDEGFIPLHSEFGPSGVHPYALDLASLNLSSEEDTVCLAFIVKMRAAGMLLALPELALPADVLVAGLTAGHQALVGPSTKVEVRASSMDEDTMVVSADPVEGKLLTVLLVDFSMEVAGAIRPVLTREDLAVITPFDFQEDHLVPSPEEVVQKVLIWARGSEESVAERVQFYSADEVPDSVSQSISKAFSQASKSRSWYRWRRKGAPSKEEGHCGHFGRCSGSNYSHSPCNYGQAPGADRQAEGFGGGESRSSPRTTISIASASWYLSFDWLCSQVDASSSCQADASSKKYICPFEGTTCQFWSGGGGRDELGASTRGRSFDKSNARAEQGPHSFGLSAGVQLHGSFSRSGFINELTVQQRVNGESSPASRIGGSPGNVFPKCPAIYGQENATVPEPRGGDVHFEGQRSDPNTIPREVWGLRESERPGLHSMAGWSDPQPYARGQSPSCKGRNQPATGLFGTSSHGQREFADWTSSSLDGGPASEPVHSEINGGGNCLQSLCTSRQPKMGDDSVTVSEGVGCDKHQKDRSCPRENLSQPRWRDQRSTSRKSRPQKETKGEGRRKEQKPAAEQPAGRGGALDSTDEKRLAEEISLVHLFASLPRWILRSRTGFSSFLARTFHIASSGTCPETAVFPIPAPALGLFSGQGVSKLNKKRWHRLCRQRVLHTIVMALNYIHGGLKPVPLDLLGRRPSVVHLAIFRRLRALMTACDRPGNFLMPPGRSGFEFIARLVELEHFASSHGAFNPDAYFGAAEDGPSPTMKVGEIGAEHAFEVKQKFSPVKPYRSLDAARLKLSGDGKWPLEDFLEDILWLPYVEPAVLLHGNDVTWQGPDFAREDPEEAEKLAKVWSARGLLALFHQPHHSGLACRVFNCHKNVTTDRQIGDRRWMNGAERHPDGPSKALPSGAFMTSISCPTKSKLVGCASDRKDFYHQAKVSRSRAATNMLPFSFEPRSFQGTDALEALYADVGRPLDPVLDGNRYGLAPRAVLLPEDVKEVYPAFNSLFQGDHLGVEFALAAHCKMLSDEGLLSPEVHVQRNQVFPQGPVWQGVVIDDFFVISREPLTCSNSEAASVKCLEKAEEIYAKHHVKGSDEKTVRGEECFTVIGAEVFADRLARDAGIVTVGAPASKRLPMICLSLKLAEMPVISRALASRAAGNWVSIFMYRRPFCCILSQLFNFGSRDAKDDKDVLELPRKVAEELVLASVFGLIAVSDVSAGYDPKVYATDASMQKGAYTSCYVGADTSQTLWLGGDRKGAYTLLDNGARQQLRALGVDVDGGAVAEDFAAPAKSLEFSFDAVEICGGSGVLSKALAERGLNVCAPIDISSSKHYDLCDLKLVEWIFFMIQQRRFRSVVVEPVCTTFSPAQHPASRSYAQPLGFDRRCPKTLLGNMLAFRCLAILWFCLRNEVIGLLEQPQLSKMAWLSIWQFLLGIGCEEAIVNSCAFGCIHKKPFRFLGCFLNMSKLAARCPGGHHHVRIEGKYTKSSAIYHPGVASHVAAVIAEGLEDHFHAEEREGLKLESVIINDLLSSSAWKVGGEWEREKPGHINVLESRALVSLQRRLVLDGGDRRFCALLDSRVAKGAHAKGSSSSTMLRPSLLHGCAYTVAGNLHPSYGFAPTRLNTADAPTRDRALSQPSLHSVIDFLSTKEIASLHACQFSRASAGWIRLFILATCCLSPGEGSWICNPSQDVQFGFYAPWNFGLIPDMLCPLLLIFATLWICSWCDPSRSSARSKTRVGLFFTLVVASCLQFSSAMPLMPVGAGEADRAARRSGNVLQADRVVLQQTRQKRDTLLASFDSWLGENWRITLVELVDGQFVDFEEVTEALVAYGKDMYQSGKSFGRFSETLNAVTARRPALRRNIAAAWDLAFNWVVGEPHEHHAALPLSLMISFVSLSLLWGWPREAAIIALCWTGVLRVGEVLKAKRSDLILPRDAAPGTWCAILKIQLPKTRGRAARHQSARIDPDDVVKLLDAVFWRLTPDEPLWPWSSPATLRKRFGQIQSALGAVRSSGGEQYALSSLRPGGATFWLQYTEDAEFVRRKGRWLSTRVLEISCRKLP